MLDDRENGVGGKITESLPEPGHPVIGGYGDDDLVEVPPHPGSGKILLFYGDGQEVGLNVNDLHSQTSRSAFPPFQARQQQGDQSQKDFIGKRDEVRDDQVKDKKAQKKGQEFRVAKLGGVLEKTISNHGVTGSLSPLKGAFNNGLSPTRDYSKDRTRNPAKAESNRIFCGRTCPKQDAPFSPSLPGFP